MAYKVILKHSSILGKRPTNENIQPGELALNTNSQDPGAFFEVSDGNIVKIGPISVSETPPVEVPEKGESWYNVVRGTLNVGSNEGAKKVWKSIASPYLGGSDIVVFVAPEFFGSSDSLLNDGQSLPFQTLNRALLEIAKMKVRSYLINGRNSGFTEKYLIVLSPSSTAAFNDPGENLEEFSVVFDESLSDNVSISDLIQFNAKNGGMIVPGNVSVKGLDFRRCDLKPSYIPAYRHPGYPDVYAGENQPLSCVLKLSGNVSLECFSITDKVDKISVNQVTPGDAYAVFHSSMPHGFSRNDFIAVSFPPTVDQSTGSFPEGGYYVNPIDCYRFYLSSTNLNNTELSGYVTFSSLPEYTNNPIKLYGTYILSSAHRLSCFKYASYEDLAEYYTKIQKAFPSYFGGKVTNGEFIVSDSEFIIVAPTETLFPDNFSSNSTRNSSCYIKQVNIRSDYGMSYGDFDGGDVQGFRSLIANECTSVSLQKDPAAYEIYTTLPLPSGGSEQKWWTLVEAAYYSLPVTDRPETLAEVSRELQLQILNQTPIEKIRYYYRNLTDSEGKSFGVVDVDNDFRHYGFRSRNSAYLQAQSIYTIGCAIGVWSLNGSLISLTNSTTNFGSIAFKSEGFRGLGTIGGAFPNAKGFQFSGIQRPLELSEHQVLDIKNKRILSLGSRIVDSYVDPNNPSIQILELSYEFSPCHILPFSLKPGSAVWVSSSNCTYRGFLATDGGPTVLTGNGETCEVARLRIRYSDSTIPTDQQSISSLDIPYIRRFEDPRTVLDRAYQFVVVNTDSNAVAPPVGSVLRLNQTSQTLGATSLKPNVQFDPGNLGGWGRLFTVDYVQTLSSGASPNFNYVTGNQTQDNKYLITLTAGDVASPWMQSPGGNPQGSLCTYLNRNWYAAENDYWQTVYYNTIFNGSVGPYKLAPTEPCSPYVPTSTLERQEPVMTSYQGSYAPDPNLENLPDEQLTVYTQGSYFRGSTIPYTEFSIQNYFDDDDGTDGMGILLKDVPSGKTTVLVSSIDENSTVIPFNLPPSYGSLRVAPQMVDFYVLSSADIENPRQTRSVLKIQQGPRYEFFQVINLVGVKVTAIRLDRSNSLYPDPVGGSPNQKPVWDPSPIDPPIVKICEFNNTPTPLAYDPDWGSSKFCVFRFFEVMGYSRDTISKYLGPRYWGERLFSIGSLSEAPSESGYALTTSTWPLEFNQPSTIIANTHTWAYCGYPLYSQGLPRYQTNDISRKLSYDFLSTTTWSGRLTVTGVNDKGEIVSFGPQREAITSQFQSLDLPTDNTANNQIYQDQPIVEFPGQVVVYTADDISSKFNGTLTSFSLTKGGIELPVEHLSPASMWVQLGGVTQAPVENYTISSNVLTFSEAPKLGTSCDIRVVTSEDLEKTLIVVPLILNTDEMDGSRSIFVLTSPLDIGELIIETGNTIVILGGVEQLPQSAYSLERLSDTEIQITFTGVPVTSTEVDIRAICSGSFWSTQGIEPVAVYSLDDISPEFSNTGQTTFLLTYGGKPVNPYLVNKENVFVSLGGTMQVPLYKDGSTVKGSYDIKLNSDNQSVISFQESPPRYATSDIRVVTNSEFLPCLNDRGRSDGFLKWGPSVVANISHSLNELSKDVTDIKGQLSG